MLEKILKDVACIGIGAAATLLEKGGEIVKSMAEKGEQTLNDIQPDLDEMGRKACEAWSKVRSEINVETMTAQERAELRRKLDEAEEKLKKAAQDVAENIKTEFDSLKEQMDEQDFAEQQEDAIEFESCIEVNGTVTDAMTCDETSAIPHMEDEKEEKKANQAE